MMFTDHTSVHILFFGILEYEHGMFMFFLFSSRKTTSHRSFDLVGFGSSGPTNSSFWH